MGCSIHRFSNFSSLRESPLFHGVDAFLEGTPNAPFFQGPEFMEFITPVNGYRPVLFVATDPTGAVIGSLLAAYQHDGRHIKAWLSRRLIIWGGPLGDPAVAQDLLGSMLQDAKGKAIYVEFRNFFETDHYRDAFIRQGFNYLPHLNFQLELGTEEEVLKHMSSNRRRQIRTSLAQGAEFGEATDENEVRELYALLVSLYRQKVGKPLPDLGLFLQFQHSPHGRVFVVRHDGRVIGGSAGPVFRGRTVYQWYVCGSQDVNGVHPSVLATWAQIDHGLRHGYRSFDFMGAGRPGQGYGVHEFKARFGGTEVCHGRYEKILEPLLYRLGALGLKVYHRLTRSK